jgi:hypothetical protein
MEERGDLEGAGQSRAGRPEAANIRKNVLFLSELLLNLLESFTILLIQKDQPIIHRLILCHVATPHLMPAT